jgi:PTH1 family peptidyl-tRNA hydrolase
MKYLIAGLGNPGPEYELTRHNAGFLALDQLADRFASDFTPDRLASVASFRHKGKQIYLIKPATYMNLSGRAVNYWLNDLKIERENLLVVTDDIALPFGKLRMRLKGSHGGHNGLRHIEETLGTADYVRLRFGVGGDFPKGTQVDHVLGNFAPAEMEDLATHLGRAADAVMAFCLEGAAIAMNKFN